MKNRLIVVLLGILLTLAFGLRNSPAEAHANLLKSEPADGEVVSPAPSQVSLWFTEPADLKYSTIQVLDTSGKRWDNNDLSGNGDANGVSITLKDFPPKGTYTVAWSALSVVDGHRSGGAFTFSIGAPSQGQVTAGAPSTISLPVTEGPPRWLDALTRWFAFAAMAGLIGATAFPFFVNPVGVRAIEGAGGDSASAARTATVIAKRSALVALTVLIAASLMALWLQSWSASGQTFSLSSLREALDDTRFGDIWRARFILVGCGFIIGLLLPELRPQPSDEKPLLGKYARLLLLPLALAIPVTTSLNSHAAAGDGSEWRTFVDWLHVVSSGLWVGGLLQLALMSIAVLPVTDHRSAFLAAVIRRFSKVALLTVLAVVVTGSVQWWKELGGVSEVVHSAYGYTLLVKVLLLLPLLGLGAINLMIVGPRFLSLARQHIERKAATRMRSRSKRSIGQRDKEKLETPARTSGLWESRFRRMVIAELALVFAILAVTALLTSGSPPISSSAAFVEAANSSEQVNASASLLQGKTVNDLKVTVSLDPGRTGRNELNIFLTSKKNDTNRVLRVIVRSSYVDQDLGESEDDAIPVHPPDHYILDTSRYSLPGRWRTEIIVRREGLLDERAEFFFEIQS